jgi:hypothetical protein
MAPTIRGLKGLFFLALLAGSGLGASAQGVADLFFAVPARYCFSMTAEARRAVISEFIQRGPIPEARMFKIKALDPKNGYLSLEGGFSGTWEMCVWNLDGGRKMAAVCANACGPVCHNEYLVFFLYAGGKLVPVEETMVPAAEFFEFFRSEASVGEVKRFYDETHSFTWHLPRDGKSLTCRYEWSFGFDAAEAKRLLLGDKLDFLWDSGRFVKGAVHW